MQKLVFILGGVLVGLLAFGLGFHLTFPAELAAQRAGYEVSQMTGGEVILEADSLRPWRLPGGKAKDLNLYTMPKRRGRRDPEPVPNLVLSMESAAARLKPFPAMGGVYDVTLAGELYDGDLEGHVIVRDEEVRVPDLLLEGADLARYPMDFGEVSVDAQGRVRLRVTKLAYDAAALDDVKGKVRLEVDGLVLDGLSFSGIELPTSTFSEAILSFTLDDGKAKVKKGSFIADTLELEIDGGVELQKKFSRSRLDLELKLKLLDESLDGLAKIALGSSRDDQGVYHFEVTGTLERPSPRPKRLSGGGGGRRPTNRGDQPPMGGLPGMNGGPMKPPPDNPDGNFRPFDREDPEARREAREERIRERREAMDARPSQPEPEDLEDEFIDEEDDYEDEEDDYEDEDFDEGDYDEPMDEPIRDLPGVPEAVQMPVPRPMADRDWPDPLPPDQD